MMMTMMTVVEQDNILSPLIKVIIPLYVLANPRKCGSNSDAPLF